MVYIARCLLFNLLIAPDESPYRYDLSVQRHRPAYDQMLYLQLVIGFSVTKRDICMLSRNKRLFQSISAYIYVTISKYNDRSTKTLWPFQYFTFGHNNLNKNTKKAPGIRRYKTRGMNGEAYKKVYSLFFRMISAFLRYFSALSASPSAM